MVTLVMKGYVGDTVGFAMSTTALKIKGRFYVQGRQPIGEDGAPQWVAGFFAKNKDIDVIALSGESKGKVYSR